MKHIKRQTPIIPTNRKTGEAFSNAPVVTMTDYIVEHPLNDKVFTASMKTTVSGDKIEMEARRESEFISLEDSDYELLLAAVETPQQVAGQPMAPLLARQYLPFMKAIVKPLDELPEASE